MFTFRQYACMNDSQVPTVTVGDLDAVTGGHRVVLDVREQHEWDSGHISGAIHIPLGQLAERRGELDPAAETMVVCHVGGRSAQATAFLVHHGHHAVNLAGGMDAWLAAGRPTV